MEWLMNISTLLPISMSGIGTLAYYHAVIKPILWGFLFVSITYRIFAYVLWHKSATFFKAPPVVLVRRPAPHVERDNSDGDQSEGPVSDSENENHEVKEEEEPPSVKIPPKRAQDELQAMSWALEYSRGETADYISTKIYRFYELWMPLALRLEDDAGVPRWFSFMHKLTKTAILLAVAAILASLTGAFLYQITQEPILGLINCDKEVIDAALHCDAYTESCHLTPPCGPHDVDYVQLVETYHNRCTGSAYPKIAMIKNVCFMDKDGNSDNNSWRHVWMKLVGSDFYSLEHTLISFYRDSQKSADELKALVDEPVRIFYDPIGSLIGYGVNTITPSGVARTNINHEDIMNTLTTWRNKKLPERKRQKPCICAPHLGILNRMVFMWQEDIHQWKIYVDHNVSRENTVYAESNLFPTYDDFPRSVNAEIASSVRGQDPNNISGRPYPGASEINFLEVNMDISSIRPIDIHTAQQIRRHWSLEGPVLQSQIPHVYFDASLEILEHPENIGFSGMNHNDGAVTSKRIIDPIAACYYQCARIFDKIEK